MTTVYIKCGLMLSVIISTSIIIDTIATGDKHKHHFKIHRPKTSVRLEPNLQKCYLTCPDGSRTELPLNILQNCTLLSDASISRPPDIFHNDTTTAKPASSATATLADGDSSNSEEAGDDDGDSEEDTTVKSLTSQMTTKRPFNQTDRAQHYQNFRQKQREQKTKKHQHRYYIKKQIVLLNRKAKSKIFRTRANLNGCHVECYDATHGKPGITNKPDGQHPQDVTFSSDSEEQDDDNYVQGEDTPVEIIYIPKKEEHYLYQTNNIVPEMWEPQPLYPPVFASDPNPYFLEDKKGTIKKRVKNKTKRKETTKENHNI